MTNREKIIQWLTICSSGCKENCPYEYSGLIDKNECKTDLMRDALELLKEQEPVKAVRRVEETEWNVCGNCSSHIISKWKWCPYCGRTVKWNG